MAYSTTTSSSIPISSTIFLAIHGLMTDKFTFLISTYKKKDHQQLHPACKWDVSIIYLFLEFRWEFHAFEKFELLVRKSSILVSRSAFEKSLLKNMVSYDRRITCVITYQRLPCFVARVSLKSLKMYSPSPSICPDESFNQRCPEWASKNRAKI